VFKKRNAVAEHIQDIIVSYTFPKAAMLLEPLYLVLAFFAFFIVWCVGGMDGWGGVIHSWSVDAFWWSDGVDVVDLIGGWMRAGQTFAPCHTSFPNQSTTQTNCRSMLFVRLDLRLGKPSEDGGKKRQ